ncbi:hypothetical protein Tco_0879877 [Tanacetum coccineum]
MDVEEPVDDEVTNPEGDKCPFNMSKPLPLQGPPGHITILMDYFFNNDLEYLKTGNKERKYTVSLTKTKDARSRIAAKSPHEVFSRMHILSVIRLTIDNQFRYGYLKDIVVRRVDLKEYIFLEANFSRLYLNDIEDMFLLYVQRKIHNLMDDEIIDLADELCKFSNGTRKSIHDILHDMLNNFTLSYNHVMPKRAWTDKYQMQTEEMVKMIDNLVLERRIVRSLECYVGDGNTKDRPIDDVSRRYKEIKVRHELSPEQTQHGDNEDALVNIEGVKELKRNLIADIEDSHHGPSNAMHNPPNLLKLLLKEEVDINKKTENQAKMTKLSMEWKRLCKIKAKVQKCQSQSQYRRISSQTGAGTEEYYWMQS